MRRCLVMLMCGLCLSTIDSLANELWPAVRPLQRTFHMNLRSGPTDIDFPILDSRGAQIYRFTCRGGDQDRLDALGEFLNINLTGPFSCLLNEGHAESEASLLSEDESAHWFSRGQFHSSELVGACASYPEFGRVRSFKLRGFKLTLSISGLVQGRDGSPSRFKFHVALAPDPSANGAQAQQTGYLRPRGSCRPIKRGNEPRMCRNGSGSWMECEGNRGT
jgi:hypothetical protein